MPRILSIATAVPPYLIHQHEIRDAALSHFRRGMNQARRLVSVFDNVQVSQRYLCRPLEWFQREHSFRETNQQYGRWARLLSEEAARLCLQRAGVPAEAVDHIVFISTSGLSTPSIDAHLINSMGFRSQVNRTPIFGLGCAGGAAGLSRALDICRGREGHRVLLVVVELSSLTFQFRDFSKSNLVACSLFSDGAAAVLVEGGGSQGPRIRDALSTLWPDTLDVMGWDFSETGLEVIFSRHIPDIIGRCIRSNVEEFLGRNSMELSDIDHYVVHPGGAKVLSSFVQTLQLEPQRLEHSRHVLETYGNMSSPTLLFILERCNRLSRPRQGDHGLCAAFGPGFSSELILLQW